MKTVWNILCVSLIGYASIAAAMGDNGHSTSDANIKPELSTAAAPKLEWKVSTDPVHRSNIKGVPNFGKLNDEIWRSGQPTREGYELLAKQGLKTVVNLREEFPQDKDLIPDGIHYVYIPIPDEHAPTADQARTFLQVASNPDNWPLLVHCHAGEGRAGVMSALVRRALDKWDNTKTLREVSNFRTSHLLFGSIPMAGEQQKFIRAWGDADRVATN